MKKITRFLSAFLSLTVLLSYAFPAFASEKPINDNLAYIENGYIQEDFKVIQLENGDRIEIITAISSQMRSALVTKSMTSVYRNSKGEQLCWFTLFGDFNTATKVCVNAYHTASNSGGSWRVEDVSTWHDTYTAYGSYAFVQRILGIKIESLKETLSLNY